VAVTITVDGTNITDKVRLDGWRVEMAANQGQVGTGRLVIDDTTGTADLAPTATEWSITASGATPTTIGGGFIGEQGIDRGPLVAGTQRQFGPVLEDWNATLTDRVLKGQVANRPEETDYQRISWLLGQAVLGQLDGAGQVPNTNTVTMDPTNYRGKTPLDVLDDCAESAGKNFYIYYDSGWKLYYDKTGSTEAAFTSSLQLSGDNSDVDSSSVFGMSDIDYEVDPERIYAVLNVKWANGWIYERNTTTSTTYRNLQKTVVKENIKKASRARAWAQRQLAKLNEPTKRLECTVSVPESALGELRAGMRIEVKLPKQGITGFTYFRIAQTTIQPRRGRRGSSDVEYDVRLKMFDKLRPVNLDDNYAGGDSSGNAGTGATRPPTDVDSGGGSGGGGGVDAQAYKLDDFSRTTTTPGTVGTGSSYANSGTSHSITLPDGCDVRGRGLVVILGDTWSDVGVPHFDTEMEALGFDHVGGISDPGNATMNIWYKRIDGSEGWSGTSDTITLSTSGGATVHSYAELLTGAAGKAVSSVINTVDPPSLTPGWDTAHSARFYTLCAGDTNRATGPSGYTEVMDASTSGNYFDAHAKTDTSAAEDPSAYAAGGTASTMTAAILLEGPGLRDTGASGISSGSFSAGSEAIDLPDSLTAGDTIVAVVQNTGLVDDLASALSAQGFTILRQEFIGTNVIAVLSYTMTGSEGWTDGSTLTWTTTGSGSYRCAMWVYSASASVEVSYAASVDPPALDPSWNSDVATDYWVYAFSDTGAPTGTPSGYELYGYGASGIYFREATKVGGTGASENPATFGGGGGNDATFTIAIAESAESGWGSIPKGFGVDTEAPWEGGNEYSTTVDGTGYASVSGGSGYIVIEADDTLIEQRLESDDGSGTSDEPDGPWVQGAEFLVRWNVDVLGDTGDTDPNNLQLGVISADGGIDAAVLIVRLGDAANTTRGIDVSQGGVLSGLVAKTISASTDYLIRFSVLADRVRAKLWDASTTEPTAWAIDDARTIDPVGASLYIAAAGNITGGTVTHEFKYIDASLGVLPGSAVGRHVIGYGDGSTVTFSTDGQSFAGGTLSVWVDNQPVLPASFDSAAGTFTFSSAPYGDPSDSDGSAVIEASWTAA